jgi:hypothetical protein
MAKGNCHKKERKKIIESKQSLQVDVHQLTIYPKNYTQKINWYEFVNRFKA